MNYFMFVKHIFKIINNSYKKITLFPMLFFIPSYFFISNLVNVNVGSYEVLISTLGILTTFFLLSVEKIDTKAIQKKLTVETEIYSFIKFKKVGFTEGKLITNTIFSFVIINVVLVFTTFILFVFGIISFLIVMLNIIYLLLGFIYTVVFWSLHLTEK